MKKSVIQPSQGWKVVDFPELWRYKDLLYFLTVRGIKARYAQSVLGIGWAIIQPLFTTLVFTIVFGGLAEVDSDGMPYLLFSYLALWPWNYFSGTLSESANSLVANAGMITKVYFPRLILPMAAIFSKLLDFLISFVVLLILLIYFQVLPGWQLIFLPILLIQLIMCSLGIGMILSAMAVQYRDIKYALGFIVQLLLYAAPVVYSTTAVPDQYQFFYSLNPMVGVIEGIRAMFLSRSMPWQLIWPGAIVGAVLFVFGLFYFRRMEKVFADVA
ncbi:lipopolysaccharide transport system permease protein [Algoriphagus ornithinivorans]|uniref:Transport permease protein n=1 Tax=Algoriphagus ornithinivorans TaxID=226506 RepID=A0A1I5HIH0_9BACT|nr:ABC transporter permease [Algoriphagus ornithinivorans]SFO48072.1 lipopolysaccharide transport system permease protein [Algoriphagus ornithinivorans]